MAPHYRRNEPSLRESSERARFSFVVRPDVDFGCQQFGLGVKMRPSVNRLEEDPKPMILVVDDDVLSLELYSRELSSNYRVISCERLEDARRCLRNDLLKAVILEPAVNGDDGWLFLMEIRSSPAPVPVIVCSVLDERKIGLEQGADAFLVKPVLPTTLHRLIDQIVSRRPV